MPHGADAADQAHGVSWGDFSNLFDSRGYSMKTITFPVYITAKPDELDWEKTTCKVDGMELVARNWRYEKEPLLAEIEVTVQLPADWNPAAMAIAKLTAERDELLADTQVKVNHINDKISKLQALTFDGVEA